MTKLADLSRSKKAWGLGFDAFLQRQEVNFRVCQGSILLTIPAISPISAEKQCFLADIKLKTRTDFNRLSLFCSICVKLWSLQGSVPYRDWIWDTTSHWQPLLCHDHLKPKMKQHTICTSAQAEQKTEEDSVQSNENKLMDLVGVDVCSLSSISRYDEAANLTSPLIFL